MGSGETYITVTVSGDKYNKSASATVYIVVEKPFEDDPFDAEDPDSDDFVIDISSCSLTIKENKYVYDGKEKRPEVVVAKGENVLRKGTDYIVSY